MCFQTRAEERRCRVTSQTKDAASQKDLFEKAAQVVIKINREALELLKDK